MLTSIRKATNNIFVKILLGLIALSFIGVGGAQFIGGRSLGNIVKFSQIESISYEEFAKQKYNEIEYIQKVHNTTLTETELEEIGIDGKVLRRMITDKMLKYLSNIYHFRVTDDKVIKFIKDSPFFKNEQGEYDPKIFTSVYNTKQKEEEYLHEVKQKLEQGALINIFITSFQPPKMVTENIVNYMAETRIVDIFEVNLHHKSPNFEKTTFTENDLKRFYESNQELFVIPEKRTFDYIKIDDSILQSKIKITDADLRNYYDDNIEEFDAKSFNSVKKEIRNIITKSIKEDLVIELSKALEDDIVSGKSLHDIAEKYTLKIHNIKDYSRDLASNKQKLNDNIHEPLFEMQEGDLSYPVIDSEKLELFIIDLKSVTQANQRSFIDAKNDVENILQKNLLMKHNEDQLRYWQSVYKPALLNKETFSNLGISSLGAIGINRAEKMKISRIDLPEFTQLPDALLAAIFYTKADASTDVFVNKNKAYFAYIRSVKIDPDKVKQVEAHSKNHITKTINDGVLHDLIFYLTMRNHMQIKQINKSL